MIETRFDAFLNHLFLVRLFSCISMFLCLVVSLRRSLSRIHVAVCVRADIKKGGLREKVLRLSGEFREISLNHMDWG